MKKHVEYHQAWSCLLPFFKFHKDLKAKVESTRPDGTETDYNKMVFRTRLVQSFLN